MNRAERRRRDREARAATRSAGGTGEQIRLERIELPEAIHDGVVIRQATHRDVTQAWNLFNAELGEDIAGSRASAYAIVDSQQLGGVLLAVATLEDRIVGALATYYPQGPSWRDVAATAGTDLAARYVRTYAQLAQLAVKSEHQSHGIGSHLLRSAETALADAGYQHWFGMCEDDARVREFYARHGFAVAEPADRPQLLIPMLRQAIESNRAGSYFTKDLPT